MKKTIILIIFTTILAIPIKTSASETLTNYIIMDMDSKRVFKSLAKDEKKLPASTTKIMTLIVALENSNPYDVVKIGNEILIADGSNIYIEPGENMLNQDLMYGMMLRSGNDAALAIANHSGNSIDNFVKLMNQKAKILKLKNTTFENPTGLDDNTKNISTVNDLAKLYSYGYRNKIFKEIVKTKTYKAESNKKSYYFKNRNEILKMYNKATGGKTGYTPKAGRILVSSASNNNLNLVIASIGNTYGYKTHINMYENIFSKYKNYTIIDKNNIKIKTKLKGKAYIKNSCIYPLKKEEYARIKKEIVYNKSKKNYIGDILVYLDNEVICEEKIYLKEKKNSFIDIIKNLFK